VGIEKTRTTMPNSEFNFNLLNKKSEDYGPKETIVKNTTILLNLRKLMLSMVLDVASHGVVG
jgi:hypothetical protein